jgi:SAM-dependent methyltransferase
MAGFSHIAEYYEILSDSAARLKREGPFLDRLLEEAPGSRAADIACGSGLHAYYLAEQGAQVDALDVSEEMVGFASLRRPHQRVHYEQADMRHLRGGPWDLVLCLGNSLSLLPGKLAASEAFTAISSCLAPEGLFAFQVLNYDLPSAREPRQRIQERRAHGQTLVAVKDLVPHDDVTLLSIAFFAFAAGETATETETAVLRHLRLPNIEEWAARAGLTIEATAGGFDGAAFDPNTSADLIGVLRKGA